MAKAEAQRAKPNRGRIGELLAFADFDGDGKADRVEADRNTMRVFLRR